MKSDDIRKKTTEFDGPLELGAPIQAIQPGSAEWQTAMKDVGTIASGGLNAVKFDTVPCPSARSPKLEIAHTIIHSGDGTARIIIHFKHIAVSDISDVLAMLKRIVLEANVDTSACNASVSEVFRNQYDFVWIEVPSLRASMLRDQIVTKAIRLLKV